MHNSRDFIGDVVLKIEARASYQPRPKLNLLEINMAAVWPVSGIIHKPQNVMSDCIELLSKTKNYAKQMFLLNRLKSIHFCMTVWLLSNFVYLAALWNWPLVFNMLNINPGLLSTFCIPCTHCCLPEMERLQYANILELIASYIWYV